MSLILEGAWKGREGGGSKREEGRKEGMDIGKLTDGRRTREGGAAARGERESRVALHSPSPIRALVSLFFSPYSVKG